MTGFFEYYLKDNTYMCIPGGGANVTPFKLPRPLFYSHAHKGFSMILVHFYIDRSRIGLPSGVPKQRDEAFVGVALGA